MENRWKLIDRFGIGAFGCEVYEDTQSNTERFLIKIFVYDKPILLSGNREILANKLEELTKVFKKLQERFPPTEPPFLTLLLLSVIFSITLYKYFYYSSIA